jgi:AcrR family transcriptional regulator
MAKTGRPKVSKHSLTSQGTRERILDAAARVVRSRGLAHATTKEIARAAGLSEAALYKYFRDKEDLFVVLMQERLPQWIGVLTDLLARAGTGTVSGNLETVVYEAILFYADFVPMAASLFAEPDILEKHQRRLHRDNLGPHHANGAVAEYVKKEQRKGRIARAVDPEAAAMLVLGGAFQRAFLRRYLGLPIEPKAERELAKRLVASFLRE